MAGVVAARVATTRSFEPGSNRDKHELVVLWSRPRQEGGILDWEGVLGKIVNFYDGSSGLRDPFGTQTQWEAQCQAVNQVRWVHKDNKDKDYRIALYRADELLSRFRPDTEQYNIEDMFCENTHQLSDNTFIRVSDVNVPKSKPLTYKIRIITGSGGFTDAVNTGALLTTGALETRQKEASRRAADVWEAYSDLLMALFDRLRQATADAIEATAYDLDPIPNNAFLTILKHNPIETTSANDALAKKCVAHFHDSETMRSAGRLVAGNWAAPSQWMTTARLAQSGINVDPDNIPNWEHTLHHASVEEHLEELGGVLSLAEAILFSPEAMVECTKTQASTRANPARYRPMMHMRGAGTGAWLWNSLTSAAQGKNALERLERAHTSTLPFGVPFEGCRYGDAIHGMLCCMLRKKKPLLALGDPTADPAGDVPTVSFRANYVGGATNTLSTWGVGVASTAIEEALQLAVATLYLFQWTKTNNAAEGAGLANFAQITALLKAPLLQGVNATVEPRGEPLTPFVDTIPFFNEAPSLNNPQMEGTLAHLRTLTDAIEWPSGTIVIELRFDSSFYAKADAGWSPDQKYQIDHEAPTEFNKPAAVTAENAINELIKRFTLGFPEVVEDREMVHTASPEDSKLRPWNVTLQFKMKKGEDNYERLRNNVLEAYRFIYDRQQRQLPGNGTWDDPTIYTPKPGTWGKMSHIAPEFDPTYNSAEEVAPKQQRVEKAIVIAATADTVDLAFDSDKLQYRYKSEVLNSIVLRLPNVEFVYDDEILYDASSGGTSWRLTYTMLKPGALKKDLVVYASRANGESKDALEADRARGQLEEAIARKRVRLDVADIASLNTPNTSTIRLSGILPVRRIGLQVYYEEKNNGVQKQYAGVVVEKNRDSDKYHVVWEDGLEGDVSAESLVVTDDRISHPFYLSKNVMSYTWKNETQLAQGDVTLADLTPARINADLSNVLTTFDESNPKLVSGVTKFDGTTVRFYITEGESYPVLNPSAFVVRIGMVREATSTEGFAGVAERYTTWDMLKPGDLVGKAVGISSDSGMQWKAVDSIGEKVTVGGVEYDNVIIVPTNAVPVRSKRTVTVVVYNSMPEKKKFAFNPEDDEELNSGPMNAGDIVRQNLKESRGGGKKEKETQKSRQLVWDVHVETPSNIFKPTKNDKADLKAMISANLKTKISEPTLTFLFNDDMKEVGLESLHTVQFTENLRAFVDFDETTHIRVNMFGTKHAVRLPQGRITSLEELKKTWLEFVNNTIDAMRALPVSPTWQQPAVPLSDFARTKELMDFFFLFSDGGESNTMDIETSIDAGSYKQSSPYKFLTQPSTWTMSTIKKTDIVASLNGVQEELHIFCKPIVGNLKYTEATALRWFAQTLFKERGYSNGARTTIEETQIFVREKAADVLGSERAEVGKYTQLYTAPDIVNSALKDGNNSKVQSDTMGYDMIIDVAKRQLIVLIAGKGDRRELYEQVGKETKRHMYASPQRLVGTVAYKPHSMREPSDEHIQNRVVVALANLIRTNGYENNPNYQGLRVVGGTEREHHRVAGLHRAYVYNDAIRGGDKKTIIKPGSRHKLLADRWVPFSALATAVQQNGLAPIIIYIDASNPYEYYNDPYHWERLFLGTNDWTVLADDKKEAIHKEFRQHQLTIAGEEWGQNVNNFKSQFDAIAKPANADLSRKFIAKKALTQQEYNAILAASLTSVQKAESVLLDRRIGAGSSQYWQRRKYTEESNDGNFQNHYRKPNGFRVPPNERNIKVLIVPLAGEVRNYDVDSGNEDSGHAVVAEEGAPATTTARTGRRNRRGQTGDEDGFSRLLQKAGVTEGDDDDDSEFAPDSEDGADSDEDEDDSDEETEISREEAENLNALFAESTGRATTARSQYAKWRAQMSYNLRMAHYFADPLASDSNYISIKIIPKRFTIRANASRTLTEISERLADDKVLRVADFPHEHVESADGKMCWTVTADGHIDPNPKGAKHKPITVYEAAANVDEVHRTVAAAFGGWHYARSTEPRQTAHALLCGRSRETVDAHVERLKRLRKSFVVAKESSDSAGEEITFSFLSLLQAMSATLVDDLVVMVKGPGRNAVATMCRVPSVKHLTVTGDKINSEIGDRIKSVLKQLPRTVPTSSLAFAWRSSGHIPLHKMIADDCVHHNLARVFTEMHLCDTVRADAGKRYHHSLPVKAGQLALRNALHDLLMCTCPSSLYTGRGACK